MMRPIVQVQRFDLILRRQGGSLLPYGGRLPVTWPRANDQEPMNVGDTAYDPLYPFGFGLTT